MAAQIVPVAHVPTARRQAAASRVPRVLRPPKLHEVINANKILGFNRSSDGQPLLRICRPEHDSDVLSTENQLELLSAAAAVTGAAIEKTEDAPRSGATCRENGDDISHSWDLLNMGLITPMNFIDRVKFRIDGGESNGSPALLLDAQSVLAARPRVSNTAYDLFE